MLKHAHGNNAIKLLVEVAVILQTDINVETLTALPGHFLLFGRNGYADHADAVVLRHKIRQTAPATADIQHTHAGLQLQFLANQTQFILLGFFEGCRLFPVGAGVLHEGIQHAAEQIVTEVVVLFAHDPRPLFALQIEQTGGGDAQRIFYIAGKLVLQTGA